MLSIFISTTSCCSTSITLSVSYHVCHTMCGSMKAFPRASNRGGVNALLSIRNAMFSSLRDVSFLTAVLYPFDLRLIVSFFPL